MKFLFHFYFFVLVAVPCPVLGQEQLKTLATEDYKLWSRLRTGSLSDQGNWVSYSVHYDDTDTMFVASTDGKKLYSFPNAKDGRFKDDDWFICKQGSDLKVLRLKTGSIETYTDAKSYKVAGENLIYKCGNVLVIRNLLNGTMNHIPDVGDWSVSPDGQTLAYCSGTEQIAVQLLDLNMRTHTTVLQRGSGTFATLSWGEDGRSIAFLHKIGPGQTSLYHYDRAGKLRELPFSSKLIPKEYTISSLAGMPMMVSDRGDKVFFGLQPAEPCDTVPQTVEVWNTQDKRVFAETRGSLAIDRWMKYAVWRPASGNVIQITGGDATHALLTADMEYAVTSHIETYEPQFKFNADRDYTLLNLSSGKKTRVLTGFSGHPMQMTGSAAGKYIAYFKDRHWHVYSIKTGLHTNLTTSIPAVYDEGHDTAEERPSYGIAGWTKGDKSVLVHDRYDLWEVTLKSGTARRLTRGREVGIRYRLADRSTTPSLDGWVGTLVDMDAPIVLSAELDDHTRTGFYKYHKGTMAPIAFDAMKLDGLQKAKNADKYVFVGQDYGHPPALTFTDGQQDSKVLFQSNKHHFNYRWGSAKRISYRNPDGKELGGILYYPAGYDPGKKYPMIVSIYERQSHRLHDYINPDFNEGDGFNVPHYLANGYFVLLPDIAYTVGKPGDSALQCVTSAVTEVLSLDAVDPNKIGLIGHSFGGYETSYIVTKTDLFATAVAGAAPVNNITSYLDVSNNYKKAEFWRFEYEQRRMGKSLFEDLEGYIANSPVLHAHNISTPLLSWTGIADTQVNPRHSMELYLAMRRLGKKHIMLRYPGQDHALRLPAAKKDLNEKVLQWFACYLKDGEVWDWMVGR